MPPVLWRVKLVVHVPQSSTPSTTCSPLPPTLSSSSSTTLSPLSTSTPPSLPPFSLPIGATCILPESASASDFFMQFFTEDLLQHIVDQTNLFAQQNPPGTRYPWYDTSLNEVKAFLGLIIAMGLKRLPSYRDYWSSNSILGMPELVAGFPLNRVTILLSNLLSMTIAMPFPGVQKGTTNSTRSDPS